MMYSLDEIGLIPAEVSDINHRSEVNPYVTSPLGGQKLPVFVAPMTCILNSHNICEFSRSKVEPILPVIHTDLEERIELPNGSSWCGWTAMTLDEFIHYFCGCNMAEGPKYHILIDVANGHMKKLFDAVRDAKQEFGDRLIVMVGNIANPETYIECCEAGVDYVRVGIGGGSGCTTSVQTGIHASLPWLLKGIQEAKNHIHNYEVFAQIRMKILSDPEIAEINGFRTKVVADGGINTIAKAIKCLALGADYVMMGQCFAKCQEGSSSGTIMYMATTDSGKELVPHHLYYGQASKEGQLDRFGKIKSNPEGVSKWVPVTTNLSDFCDKFEAALRSAMSYCGAKTLNDFIGKVKYEYMSQSEFSAFIK